MSTIGETLAPFRASAGSTGAVPHHPGECVDWGRVEELLQQREDQIREDLSVIAAQLGTFPEFVAEAFAEVGLGTPPSPVMREMLRHQFAQRMAWLQEQYRQQGGGQ